MAKKAKGSVAAVAGDLVDVETMYAAKTAARARSARTCSKAARPAWPTTCPTSPRSISTPTIAGIETADAILLVGTNPRWEASLVNTRIRKAVRAGAKVFAIGPEVDLTYRVEWLGNDLSLLADLPERRRARRGASARR